MDCAPAQRGLLALEPRILISGSPWSIEVDDPASISSAPAVVMDLSSEAAGPRSGAEAGFLATPLSFEINRGQVDPRVDLLARGEGSTILLSGGDALISLTNGDTGHVVQLTVVGSNPDAQFTGDGLLTGYSSYLVGSDPEDWITDVSHYERALYSDIYEGIDLQYRGSARQLEYDFIVGPDADPESIQLAFEGVVSTRISDAGDLVFTLNAGGDELRFTAPYAYQENNGAQETVTSRYVIAPDGSVGFEVGDYDATRTLIIDPILDYGTYLGGVGADRANAIASDAAGNTYITGVTASADFPTVGPFDATQNGGNDVFITKLSADGSTALYSTYLGGSGDDHANNIAVNGAGEAFVTGETESADFATTGGAFDQVLDGTSDVFVARLNAAGNGLVFSTLLGGNNTEEGRGIVVDGAGNSYVTGFTMSNVAFPTTGGALDTTLNGTSDAFVVKLDPTGASVLYGTYLGGSSADVGNEIDVDGAGNAYVTGVTDSGNFTTTGGAFDTNYNGNDDAFFVELNAAGSALIYSTYLGGAGDDEGRGIVLNGSDDIYVTGTTGSAAFPTTGGVPDTSLGGVFDAFVLKFSAAKALDFSTYFGGSDEEFGNDIAVDASGLVHVVGVTLSGDLAATADAHQGALDGPADAYVLTLNPLGTQVVYATYLGGPGTEYAAGVDLDSAGNLYVAGFSDAAGFDTTGGAFDTTTNGDEDAFVAKISALATSFTGTVYSDAGTTPIGAGKTIRIAVNGVDSGTTAQTDAGGAFAVSGISVSPGDLITAYIENETEDAVAVMVSDGSSFTGLDLYRDRLIVNGNLTNADLTAALVGGESDITNIYTTDGSDNLTLAAGKELFIPAGSDFTPGADVTADALDIRGTYTQGAETLTVNGSYAHSQGTFVGGGGTVDVNGDFTISGGTFTAPSGTLAVSGSFTKSGSPTWDANGGLVSFDGTVAADATLDASGLTFAEVAINRTVAGSANYTFTIAAGTIVPLGSPPVLTLVNTQPGFSFDLVNDGTITSTSAGTWTTDVSGVFTNNGTITANNLTAWTMNGDFVNNSAVNMSSMSTVDVNASGAAGGSYTNSAGSALTTAATPTWTLNGSLVVAAGTTFPANATVTFDGTVAANATLDASGVTFAEVAINRTVVAAVNYTFTIAAGTTAPLGSPPVLTLANTQPGFAFNLVNDGTITTTSAGTWTANVDGVFTNNGTITANSLTAWTMNGSFTNDGTASMTSVSTIDVNASGSGVGSYTNNVGSSLTTAATPTWTLDPFPFVVPVSLREPGCGCSPAEP